MRILSAALAASFLVAAPTAASAAPTIDYTTNVGGTFGNNDPTPYRPHFNDSYSFATTIERLVTVTLGSSYPTGDFSQNVNFISNGVTLNGTLIPTISTGQVEERSLFNFRLPAGTHEIVVRGAAGINGSYLGAILLSGVPEPATWALMILGFGAVGAGLRRRRATTAHAAA